MDGPRAEEQNRVSPCVNDGSAEPTIEFKYT